MLRMLENIEGTIRYEFYLTPIRRSNIDDTIVEWRPTISYHQRLVGGSTCSSEQVAGINHDERVKRGNEKYKNLLEKGFKVVTERSFA